MITVYKVWPQQAPGANRRARVGVVVCTDFDAVEQDFLREERKTGKRRMKGLLLVHRTKVESHFLIGTSRIRAYVAKPIRGWVEIPPAEFEEMRQIRRLERAMLSREDPKKE